MFDFDVITGPGTAERRPATRRTRPQCSLAIRYRKESAYKPGSVESSHSSRLRVAAQLERPTRELVWAHSALPYSVLLRVGFAVPQSVTTCAVRSYRTFSPLPAVAGRRFVFCGTFRRLAPPRRYLAPCPSSPDFPPGVIPAAARPTPGVSVPVPAPSSGQLGSCNCGTPAGRRRHVRVRR